MSALDLWLAAINRRLWPGLADMLTQRQLYPLARPRAQRALSTQRALSRQRALTLQPDRS